MAFAGEPHPYLQPLDELRKKARIPGMAVVVIDDNQVVFRHGFGVADRDASVAVTPDTPFWIASVTKPLVALTLLDMESDGALSLNDTVATVPKYAKFCAWLSGSPLAFGDELDCQRRITLSEVLQHRVQGPVADGFRYNPIMYSRLSRFVEHHLGQGVDAVEGRHNRLAQEMQKRLFAPAGLHDAMASQWDAAKADVYFRMAEGFALKDGRLTLMPAPERHLAGGAGVVSTVNDLAKFDIALDRGQIADNALVERMFTPPTDSRGTPTPYAYGWYVQDYQGETLYWHGGWDPDAGFSALYL